MKIMRYVLVLLTLLAMSACSTVTTQYHPQDPAAFSSLTPTVYPSIPSVKSTPTYVPPAVEVASTAAIPIPTLNPHEVGCVADAIYHEARGEVERGRIAVGYVVVNRIHNSKFPSSACAVVHQGVVKRGKHVRGRCQFAWYCDGRADEPHNAAAYARSVELAKLVLLGVAPNPIGKDLYFHCRTVHRRHNRRRYASTHMIGNQFFYSYAS